MIYDTYLVLFAIIQQQLSLHNLNQLFIIWKKVSADLRFLRNIIIRSK